MIGRISWLTMFVLTHALLAWSKTSTGRAIAGIMISLEILLDTNTEKDNTNPKSCLQLYNSTLQPAYVLQVLAIYAQQGAGAGFQAGRIYLLAAIRADAV